MKCNIKRTLERIAICPEHSPTAIFKHCEKGFFDVVYAKTVEGARLIDLRDYDLIGVFHRRTDPEMVEALLKKVWNTRSA